ncbi:MAG: J domain-containing protein [Clostridia bacterium]|nr:J domain-containing protein [Clostridia bacterium]
MNKNYYEILQVDKNASPEIIERAYKVLAKKYHPDVQPEDEKQHAEMIFKQINEAYEVLSDKEKRKAYNETLHNSIISVEEFNRLYNENKTLKSELYDLKNQILKDEKIKQQNINNNIDYNNIQNNNLNNAYFENELQQARQKAYYDAYIQDLKARGYKIKYEKTPSEHFKSFISIVLVVLILYILYRIPSLRNFLANLF